jgi:MinD-like ATPase involved in chromosome partitioning or flagellar assembly
MGQNTAATDATNGIEGLMRMFSSNRVDADAIASYARPVLKDRLDVLLPLKSRSKEEFQNAAKFYSPIIDAANKYYDLVLVDMCKDVLPETRDTIMNLSSLVVVGLNQNSNSIKEYLKLKERDEKYRKNNVITALMKYDDASMFNAKNMARELKEKDLPLLVPYNIHFSDECSSGRILDYLLKSHSLHFTDRPDGYFYNTVKDTVDRIDTLRQQVDYGLRT